MVLCLCLLVVSGCSFLAEVTMDNPTGSIDPNTVAAGAEALVAVGGAAQAVGAATANPAIVGAGVLIAVVGGALIAILKGKK